MTWTILAFAFATLGSKVLLGLAVVYLFIPDGRECSHCDAETARVESPRGLRAVSAVLRIQSRWCARCGETSLARGGRPPRLWVGHGDVAPRGVPPGSPSQAFERRPQ